MAIEPNSIQRDKMLSQGKTKLTLAQFLVPKDIGAMKAFFAETAQAVMAESGTRNHQLKIDQAITPGEFPHNYLVVDSFPSSQTLLMAHENTREVRQAALQEDYAILVKPDILKSRLAKWLGFMENMLTQLMKTSGIREMDDHADHLNLDTDPDLEKIRQFSASDLEKPLYMMNLNQFMPGGKRNYNQYSTLITPYLVSVGGYPVIYGKILSTYIGDQMSSLYNRWHDFALVYYPSRTSFLRLMTNTPRSVAGIRRAGLKNVILMAASQIRD